MAFIRDTRTTERPPLDESDLLVRLATHGNRDAIAAVFTSLGGVMEEEARAALGPSREHRAASVVRGFLERLLRGEVGCFEGGCGYGIPFLRRAVRAHVRWSRGRRSRTHAAPVQ